MGNHSRFKRARAFLKFWCLFIGIGAVAGSVGMLTAPDGSNLGMQALLPYFQVLPFAELLFSDFVFPGISLLIVNGITNLLAAFLMFKNKKSGVVLGTVFGFTLMAWITIQFVIFPFNFMSTTYFIFGIAQALTGIAALIFKKQVDFVLNSDDYPDIGKKGDELVVYFSRMGYTKREAYTVANKVRGDIYEIKPTERTKGTLGFWWCGRFGMHSWAMPIENINIDFEKYKHITICTPVWVFGLAGPMKSFCKAASGKIHSVSYIIVHFQNMKYGNVAREMDALLGVKAKEASSVCCRQGRIISRMSAED